MKQVGVNSRGYAEIRNFCALDVPGYAFVKVPNYYKLPAWFAWKLGIRSRFDRYWNTFRPVRTSNVGLFHLFNGICVTRHPWVVTFETNLPRWGAVSERRLQLGRSLLAGNWCRKIIAISECTRKILTAGLSAMPEGEAILRKVKVMMPPQVRWPWNDDKWAFPDGIRMVIVGHDFFRKGGMEVLRVFDRFRRRGCDLHLSIFSKLQYGDGISRTTRADWERARDLIAAHQGRITWKENAPQQDVMSCLHQAHVGLLPSWNETFGYSVLEAQAAGCACITTDIRAFPEFNSGSSGWLISVDKEPSGNARLTTMEERQQCSRAIEEGLDHAFQEMVDQPAALAVRARAGWERIAREHDPVVAGARLAGWYDEAGRCG